MDARLPRRTVSFAATDESRDARQVDHLREDAMPLVPGEIVEVTVEMLPTTARLKKGWRIVLCLQPDIMYLEDPFDDYSAGATYTIHTGGECGAYMQLPVIPE